MIWPCCLWDSEKNRELAVGLLQNHYKTKGEKMNLLVIDHKLQVRTDEQLKYLKTYTLIKWLL